MPRREFPERVKVKRLHFAEFKCEGVVEREDGEKVRCNATLAQGRVEFDHDTADNLGGEPTFENCRALCKVCHAEKTKTDRAAIDQAKRRESRHVGAYRSQGKIKGRSFPPSAKPKREPRLSLKPKALYR